MQNRISTGQTWPHPIGVTSSEQSPSRPVAYKCSSLSSLVSKTVHSSHALTLHYMYGQTGHQRHTHLYALFFSSLKLFFYLPSDHTSNGRHELAFVVQRVSVLGGGGYGGEWWRRRGSEDSCRLLA